MGCRFSSHDPSPPLLEENLLPPPVFLPSTCIGKHEWETQMYAEKCGVSAKFRHPEEAVSGNFNRKRYNFVINSVGVIIGYEGIG